MLAPFGGMAVGRSTGDARWDGMLDAGALSDDEVILPDRSATFFVGNLSVFCRLLPSSYNIP
jgi:hypothetical protein